MFSGACASFDACWWLVWSAVAASATAVGVRVTDASMVNRSKPHWAYLPPVNSTVVANLARMVAYCKDASAEGVQESSFTRYHIASSCNVSLSSRDRIAENTSKTAQVCGAVRGTRVRKGKGESERVRGR